MTTTTQYDSDDRPILSIAPDGTRNLTVYNALGKVAYGVQAEGSALARTTGYEYDELGQRVKTLYTDGSSTRTSYSA